MQEKGTGENALVAIDVMAACTTALLSSYIWSQSQAKME
jgi:hypothetical protein